MKKNKICIMILTGIYIFFISIFNVKAEVLNGVLENNLLRLSTSAGNIDASYNSNNIAHIQLSGDNINELYELRSFFSYRAYYSRPGYHYKFTGYINTYQAGAYSSIVGAYTTDANGTINGACTFEASGNQTQYTPFTVDCYVPGGLSLGNYSNILVFQFATTGNTPENNTNFWFYLNTQVAMYKIEDSNSQIATDTNDIKNSINEDVDNNYKQTPNQSDYNNYHQKENDIIGQISNTDTSSINIQNNNNANLFIWDTITKCLQSHAKVMALMISILSIGIIKLILNR